VRVRERDPVDVPSGDRAAARTIASPDEEVNEVKGAPGLRKTEAYPDGEAGYGSRVKRAPGSGLSYRFPATPRGASSEDFRMSTALR
jgi:hypothetical protein